MEQVHLFTKKLKPTHISHTLSFPTHVLEAFSFPQGAHMMKFEAVDATDNEWTFSLSTRLTGAYPKPVLLRSSWHRFVEQKGLAPEDRVLFFMERDDMVRRYTVRAQRKVMILMGQDVWVDVEDLPLGKLQSNLNPCPQSCKRKRTRNDPMGLSERLQFLHFLVSLRILCIPFCSTILGFLPATVKIVMGQC
ncbi:hypothetical protein POTOM_013079 [Populus tomentosa]|uniref:TF-B3 domain-containing protein n=1 Tax=Populus tomentosa TaxID=118781 RepID=A0A8X8A442_POPTO|nr:hypothetical protein POTOM_013079 [Populus tomentosa]